MKCNLFGAALALALAAPVAHAQVSSPIKFGVAGGLTIPAGSLKDDVANNGLGLSSGYNLQGMLGVQAPMVPFGLRIDAMYNKMSNGDINVDYSNWAGTANAIVNLGMAPMVSPYLIGGVGLYNQKLSGGGASESKTSFGLNGGAGLRFSLSGFSTFAEARYHYVNSKGDKNGISWDNTSFVPISFGIMF